MKLPHILSSRCARHVLHFSSYYTCFCHLFNFIYIGPSFFVAVRCVYIQVYLIKLLFRFLLYVPLARLSFPLLIFFLSTLPCCVGMYVYWFSTLVLCHYRLRCHQPAPLRLCVTQTHLFATLFFCSIYCAHSFTSNCTGILFCLYMYIHRTSWHSRVMLCRDECFFLQHCIWVRRVRNTMLLYHHKIFPVSVFIYSSFLSLSHSHFCQRKSKHFASRTTANRLYLYRVFNFSVDCFQVSINNYMHTQSFVGFHCLIKRNVNVSFGNRIKVERDIFFICFMHFTTKKPNIP